MPQYPITDVFIAWVAEDAVRQHDTHAPAGPQPLHAAFDEQHFRRDGGLERLRHDKAVGLSFPTAGQLVMLQDGTLGDGDVRTKRRVGGDDINRPQTHRLTGWLDTRQMPGRKFQRV